jgi:hypothetical protein
LAGYVAKGLGVDLGLTGHLADSPVGEAGRPAPIVQVGNIKSQK